MLNYEKDDPYPLWDWIWAKMAQKWPKNGPKWPKMAQNGLKIANLGHFWA